MAVVRQSKSCFSGYLILSIITTAIEKIFALRFYHFKPCGVVKLHKFCLFCGHGKCPQWSFCSCCIQNTDWACNYSFVLLRCLTKTCLRSLANCSSYLNAFPESAVSSLIKSVIASSWALSGRVCKTWCWILNACPPQQLNYQWQKTGQFFLNAMTYNLAWDPQGKGIHIWTVLYLLIVLQQSSTCQLPKPKTKQGSSV